MDSSSSLRGFGSEDEHPKEKTHWQKSPSRRPFWSRPSPKPIPPSPPPVLTHSSTLEELEAKHVLETLHLRFHTAPLPLPTLPPLPSRVSTPRPVQRVQRSCFQGRKVCVGTFGGRMFVPVSPGGLWEKKRAAKSHRILSNGLPKRSFGASARVLCK